MVARPVRDVRLRSLLALFELEMARRRRLTAQLDSPTSGHRVHDSTEGHDMRMSGVVSPEYSKDDEQVRGVWKSRAGSVHDMNL